MQNQDYFSQATIDHGVLTWPNGYVCPDVASAFGPRPVACWEPRKPNVALDFMRAFSEPALASCDSPNSKLALMKAPTTGSDSGSPCLFSPSISLNSLGAAIFCYFNRHIIRPLLFALPSGPLFTFASPLGSPQRCVWHSGSGWSLPYCSLRQPSSGRQIASRYVELGVSRVLRSCRRFSLHSSANYAARPHDAYLIQHAEQST